MFRLVIRRTMGTFAQQESLPNLPVPPLKQTLQKYLDSVRPVVSERQFLQTKAIVEEFESSPVTKQLNEQLVERSKTTRNWLEEWWEHLVYLAPRYPIFPLINFGGCNIRSDVWPPINGSAPERAGLQIHFTLQFWKLLRQEALPVQKTRGNVLCMNQFHRLFNTCRIPGSDVDEFKLHFKTESEGSCPSHMVVLCNGKLFRLECFDDNGEPFTPPQIASAIRAVWIEANISPGPYVNTLTVSERSHWYEMREHLKQLSPENGSSLEQLESAIFVLSLTEENIFRPTDLHRFSITGHPKYQWADKSVVWHVHRNGLGSTTSDHGPFDAITTVAMSHFVDLELQKINFTWPSKSDDGVVPHFKELKFTVDDKIKKGINTAIETWSAYDRDLEVEYWEFSAFGNEYLKPLKIYGDTVVQLAMQLAYLRLHSRPAPTYETATTRKFYHGRTETVRSCTVEAVEWAKLMIDPKANDRQRGEKLLRAIKKHNQLMDEAQNNHGCDRHLMGLQVLAKLNGMADPPIFSDPSWTKSGGGGNFVLSTSFVGYTNVAGGVAPMMTDGYGCFYRINDNLISFFTSRWKSSGETNLLLWRDSVTWSLRQIKLLIDNTTNPSKM